MAPKYLRWVTRGKEWWHEIGRYINVGAVFESLRCADTPEFVIPVPPVAEQQAIAHILGTLDDKIELNRKTNETLEAMAKALFKSWFVDFDPVRAKAEGRPTGLPDEISELFPDSFENSDLGEIPRGWRVAPVGEVVECVGGSTPSTSEPDYWDGGEYFWATPKDLSSLSEPFLLETAKKITASGVERISSGILPAGTVLLSSRAPVGYVAVATTPLSIKGSSL
jgi:type I restriction enzyme S subunit